MKRIDTINARENMFGVGKSGFHDNADLQGQDATYVSPEWFNTVQEELCNLLELRGITLDPASKRQLYDLLTTQADLEALADEIETNFIRKNQIADDLTTSDATKVASANTVKTLQDNKLDKTALNNTLTSTSIEQALTAAQGKVLLGMFASSHTQNGYQKIANPLDPSKPLIIQWGKPGIINSGTTINFPIAFPSQVFIVIASDYQGNAVIGTSDWTLTNFKSRSGSAIAYNWFAVGF